MEAVFGTGPNERVARAAGIKMYHHTEKPNGASDQHEGDVEKCRAPECQWPRLRGLVTVRSDGRDVTGTLNRKDGRRLEVGTQDGKVHRAFLVTARRPEWGVYCPHGTKLIEAEPAEHTCELPKPPCERSGELGHLCIDHQEWCKACYPDGRKILPWPCAEENCTEAAFDRERQEEEEAYYEEMCQSYYG